MSEKMIELVDKVINDAQDLMGAFEWGRGIGTAKRELEKSREELIKEIEKLEKKIK